MDIYKNWCLKAVYIFKGQPVISYGTMQNDGERFGLKGHFITSPVIHVYKTINEIHVNITILMYSCHSCE